MKIMSLSLFKEIVRVIEAVKGREALEVLEAKYPEIPSLTLGSLLSNHVQRKMKATHSRHNTPERIEAYYQRYLRERAEGRESGIVLRISDEIEITPVLTARFVLEGYLRQLQREYEQGREGQGPVDESEGEGTRAQPTYSFGNIRSEITRLLRNTNLIEDKHIAYEVYLCLVHDDHYGPCPDVIKRTVGLEYENVLMKNLDELNVSYLDEKQLRLSGYDKTPDFKLDIPIAVEGHVVNWIESKATFGDEETHKTYLNDQLTSYFNRFGPGLVIYWLGYVDTIKSFTPKGIIVRDAMPTNITKMDPSILTAFRSGMTDDTPATNPFMDKNET